METAEVLDTPVETAADAPPPEQSIDDLLAEFDAATKQSETSLSPDQVEQETTAPDQSVDPFADLLRSSEDKQRIDQLTGELDALRTAEYQRQELAAFNQAAEELQAQMPSWVPSDYAKTKMEALGHDPLIAAAWELRNVDRKAANLELQKALFLWGQLQANPNADPKQVAELQRYGRRLEIAVNSHSILRKATLGILNEANKLPKPYDENAQDLKEDIAFAMKGASAPILPDPPIAWGKLGKEDFRRTVMNKFGYDPGLI